jgi:uncharacterized membrane protein (DUF106 family)
MSFPIDYLSILAIGGVSSGLALLTQIINKLMINEKKADEMTNEMNSIQKELKTLDPKSKEFSNKQEKMLDINLDRMKMQFKPMFVTFLPYIIMFYIVSGFFAYGTIVVGSTVDLSISGNGHVYSDCLGIDKDVINKLSEKVNITSENCTMTLGNTTTTLELGKNKPILFTAENMEINIMPPSREYIPLPVSLPIVGDSLGWLGVFIIFSFASSAILSKLLKGKYLRKWE